MDGMRRVLVFVGASCIAVAGLGATQDTGKVDAAKMARKLNTIVVRGENAPKKAAKPLRTDLIDKEVNAYFRINGPEFLPVGVLNPQIFIDSGGRVSAKATVDLDAALKPKERSVFDPLAWVGGKTEVTASGVVRAQNGKGQLQLESATLAGITIPKSLLQQLVSYYTRTPEEPAGFDIDKPFDLPANITSVETSRGQAIVVQP